MAVVDILSNYLFLGPGVEAIVLGALCPPSRCLSSSLVQERIGNLRTGQGSIITSGVIVKVYLYSCLSIFFQRLRHSNLDHQAKVDEGIEFITNTCGGA
jgi:hypothetical protein